jgi:hypothetical protein
MPYPLSLVLLGHSTAVRICYFSSLFSIYIPSRRALYPQIYQVSRILEISM